jgi:hypothetical protein
MYSDYEEDDSLEYSIRKSNKKDVILLFKSIKCNESNSNYIYSAMANNAMPDFIKDIMTPYINNGYENSIISFLDGWLDYNWDEKLSLDEKLKIKNMIVLFLRTDKIKIDEYYIPILYNTFNISYYAETMMG